MDNFVYYTGLIALFFVLTGILYSFLVISLYNYQTYVIEKEKRTLNNEILSNWLNNL